MPRHQSIVLVSAGLLLLAHGGVRANPPANDPEAAFQNTLIVQQAMLQARHCILHDRDPRKAVEVLEKQLPRINGNAVYLALLRDAYRAYITELYLCQQPAVAQKYLARLSILDVDALHDTALRPTAPKTPASKSPANDSPGLAGKGTNLVKQLLPRPQWLFPQPKAPTVRAKLDDDPFDLTYKHGAPPQADSALAKKLVTQAEGEFSKRRYGQARALYEQAHQADRTATAGSVSRWAYCKLNHVVEVLNQADLAVQALPALQQEVQAALEMAPGLKDTGAWVLGELDKKRNSLPLARAGAQQSEFSIQHKGRDAQGWQVAETPHFRIHYQQASSLAEKVGRAAERTRAEMSAKWFGGESPDWNPKCDVYLYTTGQDYYRATGVAPATPGHAKIHTDKNSGRILDRRIDLHCDVANMIGTVLPHETTHVVLAGRFGPQPMPRWADEGMAVLTEPADRVAQHRRNLARAYQEGSLFGARELMLLPDWPNQRRISTFYAQSVHLVDYLTRLQGPRVFADFLRDGLQTNYEQALQKHYDIRGFNDLQARWRQQVLADVKRISPGLAGR